MREMLKEAIEFALAHGRLTYDNGFLFDGEPIESDMPAEPGEYDEDGWSYETSHGCRRHKQVDARVEKLLASGTPAEREVAQKFPRWFGYGDAVPIEPGSQRRRLEAPWPLPKDEHEDLGQAQTRYAILWNWLMGGSNSNTRTWLADFWIQDDESGEWIVVPGHSYIWCEAGRDAQVDTLNARLPASILSELENRIKKANGPQPGPRR